MKIEVCFTPAELAGVQLPKKTAAVIDVLRATTTMVTAVAAGARSIYPVASVEEAVKLAQALGRPDTLLCGERRSLPVPGFDLGNSPGEFIAERVAGRSLVMTTTNGTAALLAASAADRVLVAALANLGATAEEIASEPADAVIVCAGRDGFFALEDAVCAGLLVKAIRERTEEDVTRADSAVAAEVLAERYADTLPRLLATSSAGRQIARAGFKEDVKACATIDRFAIVPVFRDKQIAL